MKTLIATVLLSTSVMGSALAAPVAAMTCAKKGSPSFAIIGIETGFFAPSQQQILEYSVTLGKFKANGEIESQKKYEQESNMKIFDNARQASDWVHSNTVVIPLYNEQTKDTDGVVLVDMAKKSATIVDTIYEETETLECLAN